MSEEKIASALGLRSLSEIEDGDIIENLPVILDDVPVLMTTIDDELAADIELSRKNIKDMIEKGNTSLDEIFELAKQSESPTAFEVASKMMKTLLDANKEFVAMAEKKKYAKEDHPAAQTNVVNNNLILSTADILKMMKGDNQT
jgi:hypothetical protein